MEIKDNLQLYRLISGLPVEQQQAEYVRLLPELKFQPKSLGYLMKKGAEFDALAGQAK